MPRVIKARYKLRSGTTAQWTANDEVLAAAEVGEEVTVTGDRLRKVGNGVNPWSQLPYRVNNAVDRSTAPADKQTLVYNSTTGLLEWRDAGKTYQAGRNIVIDDPNTATPTINSDAGLQIDNRVATYSVLPSPPTEGTGATYLVEADGLLYVWNGSAWPAEGEGERVGGGGGSTWNEAYGTADPHWDKVVLLTVPMPVLYPGRPKPVVIIYPPNQVDALLPSSGRPELDEWTGQDNFRKFNISSYDKLSYHRDWQIGSNDFTIELWLNIPSGGQTHLPFVSCGFQSGFTLYCSNSSSQLLFQARDDIVGLASGVDAPRNTDFHLEVNVISGVAKMYLNGSVIGSPWTMGGQIANLTDDFNIGWAPKGSNNHATGTFWNIRITVGVARHSGDFTPPDKDTPLPNH